jgi:hypothetical protein
MGPEFIIQRVLETEGGWADTVNEKLDEEQLPDEGLPMVKPRIVEHLENDINDPVSMNLVATIRLYVGQKNTCHDQVKFIFSHPRNNNEQTVNKAKDMRRIALTTWDVVSAQMKQKIKDDSVIASFDEGQRFYVTVLRAENLPMFDQYTGYDPYCTVMLLPVHIATPKLDGRKTECIHCANKTEFGKTECMEHKSDWIANSQTPQWKKKITIVLDAGTNSYQLHVPRLLSSALHHLPSHHPRGT